MLQEDPVYMCLKLHVAYLRIMLRHCLTFDDIREMDKLIYKHQHLFEQVHLHAHV